MIEIDDLLQKAGTNIEGARLQLQDCLTSTNTEGVLILLPFIEQLAKIEIAIDAIIDANHTK